MYITDDFIPTFEKPPHLRQLTVASSNIDSTISSNLKILDCELINDISLVGNPLHIQFKLKNLSSLKKLTLSFDGVPTDTLIERLVLNTDSVSEFTLIFGSTYYHARRQNYIQEIDDEFLKYLSFPKLKRLSIFSRDTINDHYKFILPDFNELIGKFPPLEVLHLSLGCEFNLAIFSNLSKHYNTLTRFVWIGNMTGEMYPDYEVIKDFRFDMIRGLLLKLPLELGRVNCKFHEGEGSIFETIFKQSMRLLGSTRGNNYSRLSSYNYCKGVIDIESDFINNVVMTCEERFLPKFENLRYLIINGLHFRIFETFDSKREMVCVYDS
ncbi:hypothetical protein CLIB1423_06S00936 [[Candida] railenensis]|uniref:Uncharacterized protein n=1 Tax=[Candida] railenensis TaxID=45579 RepID=A0A9P0QPF4_9ASCO|nr:hypothetical protein CLIB1423_06S00936 [[Candida] railenensis]